MSGGIPRESTLSETTKRNYNSNIDRQVERRRGIIGSAPEELQRLRTVGLATVDYRTGRVVRI